MREGKPLHADGSLHYFSDDFSTQTEYEPQVPLSPFPDPSDFPNYSAYHRDVTEWKQKARASLRSVILPVPLSVSVWRPRGAGPTKPPVVRKGGPPPYGPQIQSRAISRILRNVSITDYSEVVETVNRQDFFISHYISPGERWQSKLVLREPNPHAYQSYAEYLTALRNWSTHEVEINHPSVFERKFDLANHAEGSSSHPFTASPTRPPGQTYELGEGDDSVLPSAQTLTDLFESTAELQAIPTCRYPASLPFSTPGNPQSLFNLFMQWNTVPGREIVTGLVRAKVYGSPWFLERASEMTRVSLYDNLSPTQFSAELSRIDRTRFAILKTHFLFLLGQIDVIKDNRMWCRMFLVLAKIAMEEPDAAIQIVFENVQTILNTLRLLSMFSAQPVSALRFVPVSDAAMSRIQELLLKYHLTAILSGTWRNKRAIDLLNASKAAIAQQIDEIVPSVAATFPSSSVDATDISLCSIIFRQLVLYKSESVFALFSSPRLLFRWLGEVAQRSHHDFGAMCCSLARSKQAQQLFIKRYLESHQHAPLGSLFLVSFTHLCGFVSMLLSLAFETDLALTGLDMQSCILMSCQMIPVNAESVLQVITAICRFYAQKLEVNAPDFVEGFFQFRMSFLIMFDQKLDNKSLFKALEALKFLFWKQVHGRDKSKFVSIFMMHLLGYMASQQESMVVVAWSIFRNWLIIEKRPRRLLSATEHLKIAFGALVLSAQSSYPMAIQLLLLVYGYMQNPQTGEYIGVAKDSRKKKVKDLLLPIFQAQKIQIATIHEKIISTENRADLARYETEVRLLTQQWKKRGGLRKSLYL
jgi:hypothetical protein